MLKLAACSMMLFTMWFAMTTSMGVRASANVPEGTAIVPDGFQARLVYEGLPDPTSIRFAPDGRLFVAQKQGTLFTLGDDGKLVPFLQLTNVFTPLDLGFAAFEFDPGFANNRYFYVWYTRNDTPEQDLKTAHNRLSRFSANASLTAADPASEVEIFETPAPDRYHTGGAMRFGKDGYFYMAVGDSGLGDNSNTEPNVAQNLSDLRGKVLRLDLTNLLSGGIIPPDNPWAKNPPCIKPPVGRDPKKQCPEIWAYGLRNPFTGDMKPGTNTFYVNDVGQESFEEINEIKRGGNYGWRGNGGPEGPVHNPLYIDPIYSYPHQIVGGVQKGAAVVGGAFYRGTQFPEEYVGNYFWGEYVNGTISRLDTQNANHPFATIAPSTPGAPAIGLAGLDLSPQGSMYYLFRTGNKNKRAGNIFKITHTLFPEAKASVDRTYGYLDSQTKGMTVHFSAAGSTDPTGRPLHYRWVFGDGHAASGLQVNHTYASNGKYSAYVIVTNDQNLTSRSNPPLSIVVGSTPPLVKIRTPSQNHEYSAGDTITFSGVATDPEDGKIPASNYEWSFAFHHEQHTHDFKDPVVGSRTGSFVIPVEGGEIDPVQGFEIILNVTDSSGLQSGTSVIIHPKIVNVDLDATVPGMVLALSKAWAGVPSTSPNVANEGLSVEAPPIQVLDGVTYRFKSWSDGLGALHSINARDHSPVIANYVVSQAAASGIARVQSVGVKRMGSKKALLSWDVPPGDINAFIVQRREKGQPWITLASVPAATSSFLAKSLKAGKRYWFRVVTVTNAGAADPLNNASLKMP